MDSNVTGLFIAGSETTATLLAGVTYLLCSNPDVLEKLNREVRSTFKSEGEIDLMAVGKLPYLPACLEEAMRMYPPAPDVMPREVPRGGTTITNIFVPENVSLPGRPHGLGSPPLTRLQTVVRVYHYAINHLEKYFVDPHGYHPERFLKQKPFENDRLDALQPFNVGKRDCIGRT